MHGADLRFRSFNVRPEQERYTSLAVLICGASAGAASLGGAIAAAVALGSTQRLVLTAAAVLAVSGAMMVHAFGALYRAKRKRHHLHDRMEVITVFGGLGAELVGGAAGGVFGLLALGDVLPYVLLPVAAVTLGSAGLLVAPAHHRLTWLAQDRASPLADEAMPWTAWALALTGMASITMGTLALIEAAPELTMTAASMVAVGFAVGVAGAALAFRYYVRLAADDERRVEDHAEDLVMLMTARLAACRSGLAFYQAAAVKLVGKLDAEVIAKLETFAEKELENIDFLEYQLRGFGADSTRANYLADIESETSSGIEHVLLESDIRDPIPVLTALHAADLHDESGWKLLTQVADEIANEELKHEIKNKYGDKAEQGRYVARLLETAVQRVFTRERLAAPMHA